MVTLDAAKAHLRIDNPHDDASIDEMIAAASDHLKSIGVDTDATPMPPAVAHAILMLVGHFFTNRDAVTDLRVNVVELGVDRLIQPYRGVPECQ